MDDANLPTKRKRRNVMMMMQAQRMPMTTVAASGDIPASLLRTDRYRCGFDLSEHGLRRDLYSCCVSAIAGPPDLRAGLVFA